MLIVWFWCLLGWFAFCCDLYCRLCLLWLFASSCILCWHVLYLFGILVLFGDFLLVAFGVWVVMFAGG